MKGSFLSSKEDVSNFLKVTENNHQEGIYVAWRTNPEAIKKILPPQFELVAPFVSVYALNIQESTVCGRYMECSIYVPVTYNGRFGLYFPGMLLTGPGAESGQLTGRESCGMTKKLAQTIRVERHDTQATAYVERNGVRVFEVEMDINGEYNSPMGVDALGDIKDGTKAPSDGFFFKYDVNKDEKGKVSFTDGKLIAAAFDNEFHTWERGTAKVTLQESITDPWAELEVLEVLGAGYTTNATNLWKSELLAEVDINEVIPYLLTGKFDKAPLNKGDRIFY